ncbi:MAG: recombination protein RecR [Candidatus Omnitrophica bacterium]|nr:recombination protein RecR [Candidatus Omnitrophota bacterium]
MSALTASMEALIHALKKLPGVGFRTAERFAFYLLTQPVEVSRELTQAILRVKETIGFCKACFNLADEELCTICRDPARDKSTICVVEHPRSIIALERSGGYRGVYHVLLGVLSPLDGIGPRDLKIEALKARVAAGGVKEIILATDSDLEGEATSLYLSREFKELAREGVQVTRLAAGIPMGSSVEYADQVTLTRAMEGRRKL